MIIVHFIPWHFIYNNGGTEIYVIKLARYQSATGNKVIIVSPNINNESRSYNIDDISVYCYPYTMDNDDGLVVNGVKEPLYLSEYTSFIKLQHPDIIHYHGLWPHLYFYFEVALKLNIKTVITPHLVSFTCPIGTLKQNNYKICDGKVEEVKCTTCFYSYNTGYKRNFAKKLALLTCALNKITLCQKNWLYCKLTNTPYLIKSKINFINRLNNHANAIVAISPWYLNILRMNSFDENKLFLVNQAFLGPIQKNQEVKFKTNDSIRIVFIGRISVEKGIYTLFNALNELTEYKDKFELYLYGKIMDDSINLAIDNLSKNGFKIVYRGELLHTEVIDELVEADCIILPSIGLEMSPLVIQEAFASGIPVIGSNIGGINDLIDHGINGLLFTVNNPLSLAIEIKKILLNPNTLIDLKNNINYPRTIEDLSINYNSIYKNII